MPRLLSVVCTVLLTLPASAQPSAPGPVSLGLSVGSTVGGDAHLAGSVSVQHGRTVLGARLSSTGLGRSVQTGLFEVSQDWAGEIGVLGGLATPVAGRWEATGLAGVSAVRTHRFQTGACLDAFIGCIPSDGGREVSPVYVGLPLEVGLHGPVLGDFGAGIRAFATATTGGGYRGVSLDLRLRPSR